MSGEVVEEDDVDGPLARLVVDHEGELDAAEVPGEHNRLRSKLKGTDHSHSLNRYRHFKKVTISLSLTETYLILSYVTRNSSLFFNFFSSMDILFSFSGIGKIWSI